MTALSGAPTRPIRVVLTAVICLLLFSRASLCDRVGESDESSHPRLEFYKGNGSATLVTALFHFPSKHSLSEYLDWANGHLQARSNLVVFTTEELLPALKHIRERRCGLDCPTLWRTEFSSPQDLPMFAGITNEDWQQQYQSDPERGIHRDARLYAVWLGKACFLDMVARENPYHSDFFLWVDMGVFRSQPHLSNDHIWPGPEAVKRTLQLDLSAHERMVISGVSSANHLYCKQADSLRDHRVRSDITSGAILGGTARAVSWFYREMRLLIRQARDQSIFFGKDQTLYNYMISKHPTRFMVFNANDDCHVSWFLLAYYFSDERPFGARCDYTYDARQKFSLPDKVSC